jgi:hypothetical protein
MAFALNATTFDEGDTFQFAIRVDKNDVFAVEGQAITNYIVEIPGMSLELLSQLSTGKQLVVRFTTKYGMKNYVFPVSGAAKALAPVIKACPALQAATPASAPTTEKSPWHDA